MGKGSYKAQGRNIHTTIQDQLGMVYEVQKTS